MLWQTHKPTNTHTQSVLLGLMTFMSSHAISAFDIPWITLNLWMSLTWHNVPDVDYISPTLPLNIFVLSFVFIRLRVAIRHHCICKPLLLKLSHFLSMGNLSNMFLSFGILDGFFHVMTMMIWLHLLGWKRLSRFGVGFMSFYRPMGHLLVPWAGSIERFSNRPCSLAPPLGFFLGQPVIDLSAFKLVVHGPWHIAPSSVVQMVPGFILRPRKSLRHVVSNPWRFTFNAGAPLCFSIMLNILVDSLPNAWQSFRLVLELGGSWLLVIGSDSATPVKGELLN